MHELMAACKKYTSKTEKKSCTAILLEEQIGIDSSIGLIEDFGAQIGSMRGSWTEVTDLEGTGHLTDNGERLLCSKHAEGWKVASSATRTYTCELRTNKR